VVVQRHPVGQSLAQGVGTFVVLRLAVVVEAGDIVRRAATYRLEVAFADRMFLNIPYFIII